MKKILTTLLLSILLTSVTVTSIQAQALSDRQFNSTMRDVVKKLNLNMPMYIDSVTKITNVSFNSIYKDFIGTYLIDTVKFRKENGVEESFWTERTDAIIVIMNDTAHNELCYEKDKLDIMSEYKLNYVRRYYRESDNRFLLKVEVSAKSCRIFMSKNS